MGALEGRAAVVTGASRGVGRGAAIGLGEAGATVYVTGRSLDTPLGEWPGTLAETAQAVTAAGGRGIAVAVDHRDDRQVAAISLYPGLVRTEGVMANAEFFDLSNSESPQFIGRCVAALALDPALMAKSGGVYVAAALALEYGVMDIDGKQPRPITVEEA